MKPTFSPEIYRMCAEHVRTFAPGEGGKWISDTGKPCPALLIARVEGFKGTFLSNMASRPWAIFRSLGVEILRIGDCSLNDTFRTEPKKLAEIFDKLAVLAEEWVVEVEMVEMAESV